MHWPLSTCIQVRTEGPEYYSPWEDPRSLTPIPGHGLGWPNCLATGDLSHEVRHNRVRPLPSCSARPPSARRRPLGRRMRKKKTKKSADDELDELIGPVYAETMTVTASRNEVSILEAPVSISVVGGRQLETSPADNYRRPPTRCPGAERLPNLREGHQPQVARLDQHPRDRDSSPSWMAARSTRTSLASSCGTCSP